MPHLDQMAELPPAGLARQQVEKGAEIGGVELLERRELPQHRPELVAEFEDAAREEQVEGLLRTRQFIAMGDEARPLHRKHEAVRRLVSPFAKAVRPARIVEGAVDLD